MIYNENSLLAEIKPMWAEIAHEVPKKNMPIGSSKNEAKRAMEAYNNAFNAFLPFIILGNEEIREEEPLLQNVGTLATDPQINIKKIANFLEKTLLIERKDRQLKAAVKVHTTQGAILNDSNWWPFRNDMFMLGAIHSGKEFHLSNLNGKDPSDESLWDKKNKRTRVLGRELIMLALAGYQKGETIPIIPPAGRVYSIKWEQVYFLPKCNRAKELTLSVCRKKFAEIQSAEEIRRLFTKTATTN